MSSAPAAGPAAAKICFGLFSGTSSRTVPEYYGHSHLNFTVLLFLLNSSSQAHWWMFYQNPRSLTGVDIFNCHTKQIRKNQYFISWHMLMCRSAGQSVGDCPELAAKLQVFMVTFFSSLPSQHRGTKMFTLGDNVSHCLNCLTAIVL